VACFARSVVVLVVGVVACVVDVDAAAATAAVQGCIAAPHHIGSIHVSVGPSKEALECEEFVARPAADTDDPHRPLVELPSGPMALHEAEARGALEQGPLPTEPGGKGRTAGSLTMLGPQPSVVPLTPSLTPTLSHTFPNTNTLVPP
jgi:hypothetical protein